MSKSELIITLHGLGNSKWRMSAISWYLRRRGFSVLNLGYPSCSYNSEQLAANIFKNLKLEYEKGKYSKVSIVGFSLGSQLARIIIERNFEIINFSRLIMLAPPNQNSSIARFLSKFLPSEKIWGPVFHDLCQEKFPNPCSKVEIGIIAGATGCRLGVNPFLGVDNDGLVTVEETRLEGAKEHKVIFATHATMPFQPRVIHMVTAFIETGAFSI